MSDVSSYDIVNDLIDFLNKILLEMNIICI